MKKGGRTASKILVCAALAAISGCAGQKEVKSPDKKPLRKYPLLDENYTYDRTISSKFGGGVCTLDADSGKITYKTENGNYHFYVPPFQLIGNLVKPLHCLAEKTVIVASNSILIADKGFSGGETVDFFGKEGVVSTTFFTPPDSTNAASVVSGNTLFVLGRNYSKNLYETSVIDLNTNDELGRFELPSHSFGNGAVMTAHKGFVLVAGEAAKGESYLMALKMRDGLDEVHFTAKKDLAGPVSFEKHGDNLKLRIGKFEKGIKVEQMEKNMDSKKTQCLKSSDSFFDCVIVDNT